jgi:hypothetical protein
MHDRLGEATSTLVPDANVTGADEVAIMAEVDTSAKQYPGTERPEVIEEGLGQSSAQPMSTSAPPLQAEAARVDASEVIPPPQPTTQGRAGAGWTEEMEDALKGSSVKEEHRALIGTALQGYRSAGAGLHEVFKNLIAGFEVHFLRVSICLFKLFAL